MATLTGWQPVTPTFYARPVQVESATAGISGAAMPDGRGVLVWPNGGRARFAVVDSPQAFLIDDIVESGDIGTIVTGSVVRTAVYNIDGEIYVTVVTWTGSFTTTVIYQADDPSDPSAGWTLAGTLQSDNTPGSFFGTLEWGAGVPIKLPSGRWVMGCGGWEVGFPPSAPASGSFVHAYYSDGGAAGPWNRTLLYGHHLSGFPRLEWVNAQVAHDPATGDLFHYSMSSTTNEYTIWRSQDSGGSWTQYNSSNGLTGAGSWQMSFPLDNGTYAYAIHGGLILVGDGANGALTSANVDTGGWSDTGESWLAPGMTGDLNTRKLLVVGSAVFAFTLDEVAKLASEWFVGFVGWSG